MFRIRIYQKASINTIILGNADVTKPSYLKQLTYVTEPVQELLLAYCHTLLQYCYHPVCLCLLF